MKTHLALALLMPFYWGCTTALKSAPAPAGAAPQPGALYALPMASFDVEVRFLVTDCERTNAGKPLLAYEVQEAYIKSSLVPDPAEIYTIPYQELNAAFKTTAATLHWHPNGMLKSINADVEDRSHQVTTSLASAALNLFKASLGEFTPLSADAVACDDFLQERIAKRRALLEAEIPTAKKSAPDLVPALEAQLATLTRELSSTARLQSWSPKPSQTDATESASKPGEVDAGEMCEDVVSSQSRFYARLAELARAKKPEELPSDSSKFRAEVCLRYPRALSALPEIAQKKDFDGVVYRMPVLGAIFVRESAFGLVELKSEQAVTLPQFGAKGLVWLSNGVFDKNSVKATFNIDGSLSELAFTAEARAERAATTAKDSSATLVDLMKIRGDAAKAKADATDKNAKDAHQRQIDVLDRQIELIEKRNALESARAPAKTALDTERELLQRRIEVETLRQQLDALQSRQGEQP